MGKKVKDSFGERMKMYEAVSDIRLMRRCPVIVRCDMRAGHTFTKGFNRPFDDIFADSMQMTMKSLCENIQGCVFGYVQSDEITLVLCDYQTLETDAWFDYRLEKVCSLSASMATRFYNKYYIDNVEIAKSKKSDMNFEKYEKRYFTVEFDSRAFNIPKEEVCNAVLWRQKDAERNSILMVAQSLYSHREMSGISCKLLQDKMFTEKGVNWNEVPTKYKRGCACVKNEEGKWFIDFEMPILTQDRGYVENRIIFEKQ